MLEEYNVRMEEGSDKKSKESLCGAVSTMGGKDQNRALRFAKTLRIYFYNIGDFPSDPHLLGWRKGGG